ncbi:MAG: PrgI family protein [Patescibacteria group bacterium]|nr:PrgI family protein [Patescibacteria group bacterium]
MQQHPVPQNIMGVEFQLIGNMTIRQFAYVGSGALIAWLSLTAPLPFLLKWTLVLGAGFGGLAFAFLPVNDIPLDRWVTIFFNAIYAPTKRVWRKEAKKLDFLYPSYSAYLQKQTPTSIPTSNRLKLEQYLGTFQPIVRKNELDLAEESYLSSLNFSILPPSTLTPPTQIAPLAAMPEETSRSVVEKAAAVEANQFASEISFKPVVTIRLPDKSVYVKPVSNVRLRSLHRLSALGGTIVLPIRGERILEIPEEIKKQFRSHPLESSNPPLSLRSSLDISPEISFTPHVPPKPIFSTRKEPMEIFKGNQQYQMGKVPEPGAPAPKAEPIFPTQPIKEPVPAPIKTPIEAVSSTVPLVSPPSETREAPEETKIPALEPSFAPKPESTLIEPSIIKTPEEVEPDVSETIHPAVHLPEIKANPSVAPEISLKAEVKPTAPQPPAPLPYDVDKEILKQRLEEMSKKITSANQERENLLSELTKVNHQIAQAQASAASTKELEKLSNDYRTQLERVRTERETLFSQLTTLQSQVKAFQESLTKSKTEKEQTQKALADFQAKLAQAESEKQQAIERAAKMQALLDDLAKQKQAEAKEAKKDTPVVSAANLTTEEKTPVKPLIKVVEPKKAEGRMAPAITSVPNVINGIVKDKNGLLVSDVIIVVKDVDDEPVRALKTNKIGQFAISTPLPNGTYTMELEKDGYEFDIIEIVVAGEILAPIEIRAK